MILIIQFICIPVKSFDIAIYYLRMTVQMENNLDVQRTSIKKHPFKRNQTLNEPYQKQYKENCLKLVESD